MEKNLTTKKEIRTHYKEVRNQMEQKQVMELSEKICESVVEWKVYQKAQQIFFYYPLGNEVNLLSVASHALSQNKIVAFPKTEKDGLHFYQIHSLEEFIEGTFHVMEPISEHLLLPEETGALFFVPGVVFDDRKNRMGFGKGYYDRYFAETSQNITCVGVAYHYQVLKKIPTHCHDIPMDYLITEHGIR